MNAAQARMAALERSGHERRRTAKVPHVVDGVQIMARDMDEAVVLAARQSPRRLPAQPINQRSTAARALDALTR